MVRTRIYMYIDIFICIAYSVIFCWVCFALVKIFIRFVMWISFIISRQCYNNCVVDLLKFRISTHLWAIYGELADSTTKSMLFLFVTLRCFFSSFFSDATIHFFFVFFTLGALNLYFFGILSFIGSFDIYMCIVWIFHMYKMNTHWFLNILRVLSYVVVVCSFSFRRMEPLDISF